MGETLSFLIIVFPDFPHTFSTRSPMKSCPDRPAGESGTTDLMKMPDTVLDTEGPAPAVSSAPPRWLTSTRPPTMLMPENQKIREKLKILPNVSLGSLFRITTRGSLQKSMAVLGL